MASSKLPTFFISHGGGPAFALDPPLHPSMGKDSKTAAFLRALPSTLPSAPKAILVISGHWEESAFTVQTNPAPPMFYDYYGFPRAAYSLKYPAPGSPVLAARVKQLLKDSGLPEAEDASRGYDHGTFIPLMVMFPAAAIPVVQLSLHSSLDASLHYRMGAALAPLREEGVLILGSGFATHNLGALRRSGDDGRVEPWAKAFVDWVDATVVLPASERAARLQRVTKAPHFRDAHPREDHFIPLIVAAAAADGAAAAVDADGAARIAGGAIGTKIHDDWAMGSASFASYKFE